MTDYFERNTAATFSRLWARAHDLAIHVSVFGREVKASDDQRQLQVATLWDGTDVGTLHDFSLDLMGHGKRKGRSIEVVPPISLLELRPAARDELSLQLNSSRTASRQTTRPRTRLRQKSAL